MIRLFAVSLLFLSSGAFACPNLAGEYHCEGPTNKVDLTVTQRVENFETIYTIGGQELNTDGYMHDIPESDLIKQGKTVAACTSDTQVVAHLSGEAYDDAYFEHQGHFEIDMILDLQADGSVTEKNTGTLTRPDGVVWNIDAPFTCVRK